MPHSRHQPRPAPSPTPGQNPSASTAKLDESSLVMVNDDVAMRRPVTMYTARLPNMPESICARTAGKFAIALTVSGISGSAKNRISWSVLLKSAPWRFPTSVLADADASPSNLAHSPTLSERDLERLKERLGSTMVLIAGSATALAVPEPTSARTVVGFDYCGITMPSRSGPSAVKVKSTGRNQVPGILVLMASHLYCCIEMQRS